MRSLTDAHGQSRTLTVVSGHTLAAARLPHRVCIRRSVDTVDGRAEQGRQRCRAERPGLPANEDRLFGETQVTAHHAAGTVSRQLAPLSGSEARYPLPGRAGKQGFSRRPQCRGYGPVHHHGFRKGVHRCLVSPEGASPWTNGCAGRSGGVGRTIGTARSLEGVVVSGADEVRGRRERDKLTIAEVCADLGVSRRTFYEWRAKGRAPRCITLPNGSLRIRRSEYSRWLASREEAA